MSGGDPRKQLARELAAALCDGQAGSGELVRRLLSLTGAAPQESPAAEPASPGRIGIWQPVQRPDGMSYERVPNLPASESRDWSELEEIAPKGRRKRLVLIGESVARGFYSDPWLTPAKILQAQLDAIGASEGYEVIDLARNNLLSWELQELIAAALALEPDAFILFGGNNWANLPLVEVLCDPQLGEEGAALLRERGVAGLASYLAERAATMTRALLSTLRHLPGPRIPAFVLVPEFNLLDWSHRESKPPWLPGASSQRWWALQERARVALEAGELAAAEACARQMRELDGGTAPAALEILARCRLAAGEIEEARALLEQARDARVCDPPAGAVPQTLSSIQEALRAERDDHLHIVDLPRVFREHLGDELPGRRLFLDYVHLTFEGNQVAMAATAQQISRVLDDAEPPHAQLLAGSAPLHDAELLSQVHFCAAVHNAHWGQPLECVQHHLARALELSAAIEPVMQELLQERRGPRWLYRLGAVAQAPAVQRFLLAHAQQGSRYDAVLRDAVTRALRAADRPLRPAPSQRDRMLRSLERAGGGGSDGSGGGGGDGGGDGEELLAPYYAPSWNDRSWDWSERHHYYRAYQPESAFQLEASAERALTLRLTYRVPHADQAPGASLVLQLNGAPLGSLPARQQWTTIELPLAAELLRRGGNTLEIRWPALAGEGEARLAEAAEQLARGALQLTPVFGELHSLKARVAP